MSQRIDLRINPISAVSCGYKHRNSYYNLTTLNPKPNLQPRGRWIPLKGGGKGEPEHACGV